MIHVVQPFDLAPIAELTPDGPDALEAKLAIARARFDDRSAWLPPHRRAAVLRNLANLVNGRREHFALLIAREGGKPYTDALVETDRAIDGIRNASELLRTRAGVEVPMGLTAGTAHRRAWTITEPIGVVAAISAFNHPLNLIVHQVAPAIATGCPIVIKPAQATPLCCIELVKLVHEAGMPEGWVQVFLPSERALSEALATDPRVAFLSFIGSARVGWHLRSVVPPGTRCALEHGGAAPVIIDRTADLDAVVPALAKGGYYHAGQVCVSVQRVFVHEARKAEFLDRFTAEVGRLRTGDPTDADTDVGPLIAPKETARVQAWIDEAIHGGAELIGGGRLSETTLLPAVLVEPSRNAKVSTQEIFGPVTCVFEYQELDDAIRASNELPMAFQASVLTQDINTALYVAERLDASAVMVNDHSAFRADWMPFAGRRSSGHGVGGIPATAREMTAEKMIVFRHFA